jgi:hypothetical protein
VVEIAEGGEDCVGEGRRGGGPVIVIAQAGIFELVLAFLNDLAHFGGVVQRMSLSKLVMTPVLEYRMADVR